MTQGLILFAHGARDPRWALPFEAVAARLRAARPELPLRLAFLEFMAPTLAQAAEELAVAGCTQLAVLPMFLGAGGHVRQDLPRQIDAILATRPGLTIRLHPAIGEIASVADAMASAALVQLDTPTAP
jgi:sirohydrochlorin cobaltochelatase